MGCLEGQPLRLRPGRPQIPQQRFLCFVGMVLICSVFSDNICGARTTSSKVAVVFDDVKLFSCEGASLQTNRIMHAGH